MRKLLLITLEWPPMHGGISEYLSGLFCALPKDRVAVLHDKRVLAKRGRLRWLGTVPVAWRMLKETRAELVAISHILPMGYIALLLKWFRKTPYIVFVHGLDIKMLKRNPWKRFWGRLVLKNAERVIANSHYTQSLTEAYIMTSNRAIVIYPCPSRPVMREKHPTHIRRLREMYGLGDAPVLLSVCRLVERKGIDTVITNLKAIGKLCPGVKYLVVGDGPDRERLECLVREYQLKNHVIFTGAVDAKDMADYFGLGDIFIMLARETEDDVEGLGIVYLEAGYHGLPIVAGRGGGVSEAVLDGETGILVDSEGGDEFVGAVCRLVKNKVFAERLGTSAQRRVREEFTWTHQAHRLVEAVT